MMLGLLVLLTSSPVYANGQTSHVYISLHAVDHLPSGDLRELLARPDLRDHLVNGTMFPDGGYAIGDDYGELAHWEIVQAPYLGWLTAQHQLPWTDEAAQHIAFLMGMASHGMSDQVYDSLYLERARVYDAQSDWESYSIDEATDIAFALALHFLERLDNGWFLI